MRLTSTEILSCVRAEHCRALLFTTLIALSSNAATEVSGYVAGQVRVFSEDPLYHLQSDEPMFSAALEPEWYEDWNNGDDSIVFKPFFRADSQDDERSHADIRELFWLHAADGWEFGLGVSKVFWGVTESQHLVDIVNQTDLVESPDGEDKLGQPMVRLTFIRDWGVIDAFWLPYFRPRTFAGAEGRLRAVLPIDTKEEHYESSDEELHQDFALRWSHSIGMWDLGLSWFEGTAREPTFSFNPAGTLTPFYPQISRAGLDVQLTTGSWLWKLEAIRQNSSVDDYTAAIGGFEYTFVGLMDSGFDLGWLMEYAWDGRDEGSTSGFQNDLFVGGRFTLNDEASTELLFGLVRDLDYSGSRAVFLEASRRFGDATRVYLETRIFDSDQPIDPLFQIREDSFLELTIEYYF